MVDSHNPLILNTQPTGRQAKRAAAQINYAEDFVDDVDAEDSPSVLNQTRSTTNLTQQALAAQKFVPVKPTNFIGSFQDETKVNQQSHETPVLIPIKISMEYPNGNHKLVDFFMWNMNDTLLTPAQFSEILCKDLDLPNVMQLQVCDSIIQQIEDYNYVSNLTLPSTDPFVVIIDLSVSLNNQLFQDRFEWDLNQSHITPEDFAKLVVSDAGLPLQFEPAIAHALHENIIRIKKEIVEGTYNSDLHNLHQLRGLIFDSGIRINTENSIQNGTDQWGPVVEILTPGEIERRDLERSRNLRRLKRENAKRGDFDDGHILKRRNVSGRRKHDELDTSWRAF
jgi:chromatin structure-remodeling complex subunit SFH1